MHKIISIDYRDTLHLSGGNEEVTKLQPHASKLLQFLAEWSKHPHHYCLIISNNHTTPIAYELECFEFFKQNQQLSPRQLFCVIGVDQLPSLSLIKPHYYSLQIALQNLGIDVADKKVNQLIKFCHIGDSLKSDMEFVANCQKFLQTNYNPASTAIGWWLRPNCNLPINLQKIVKVAASLDEIADNIKHF